MLRVTSIENHVDLAFYRHNETLLGTYVQGIHRYMISFPYVEFTFDCEILISTFLYKNVKD